MRTHYQRRKTIIRGERQGACVQSIIDGGPRLAKREQVVVGNEAFTDLLGDLCLESGN